MSAINAEERAAMRKFLADTLELLGDARMRARQMAIDLDADDPIAKHYWSTGKGFQEIARDIQTSMDRLKTTVGLYEQWSSETK